MGAITLPSPAGWKLFRSQTDSASNSTGAAPTPPIMETQPPLVSQLVCTGGEETSSSESAPQGQAKTILALGEQTKPASSAPATLRPNPKLKAATRPRSFIATSKVKTFGKPSAPIPAQQQLPPANTSRPTEQTGLLRSLAAKKRLPRWLSRSSDAIEVSKPQLVSTTSGSASMTALEPILLLRRAETAPGLPSSLAKEVSAPIPSVTFEHDGDSAGRKRSASMSTAQLLEEAATKLMRERSTATGQGKVLPIISNKDAKTQGKTSVDIISRDAKLQNGLREVLNSKSNKSTPSLPSATAVGMTAKARPSDTPPHSISRKAVPKLPSVDSESDFLPQELPLKSEMLYPGISSSVHLSTDAPTLHNIVVARASDEFERSGDDANDLPAKAHDGTHEGMSHAHDDADANALKDKVIDLTREVEAWKKSKLAQRASRQEQEQHKKVRRVRVQDVDMDGNSVKENEKTQEQTVAPRGRGSAEVPRNAAPAQSATPSKHRISRSSNGSQRSRPPSVPLPSLPTTPRKPQQQQQQQQQQRALPQRKVSEAATQTSELAFIVTHRDQRSNRVSKCSPPEVDTAVPLIDLDTPSAQDRQTVPASAPAPGHSPADETLTFISQEEASLDFGSLGPPTDSSCLPSSNAARLSTKHAAGVHGKGGGQKSGKLANATLPILNGGRKAPISKPSEKYISSYAYPSLRRPSDQQALETQFWSLLAQVQAREFGYTDALGHELADEAAAAGVEAETSSTSTLSFAGIRDWRERVASEAGRLRKTHHGPAREVFLAAATGDDGEMPHMLRGDSLPGELPLEVGAGQWENLDLPSAIFPPTSTLATRGSASLMTETNVQMQLAQNGTEESDFQAPVRPHIPPLQVQTHVSTASSSMLSWGTRCRRTLSEHEAQRLFGSLPAVPKAGEEWGVKSGLAADLEERLAPDQAGERGRKRHSRNTFGVASFDQRQKAGQLTGTHTSREAGVAAHNTLTTTTTTTTATQSVISVTRSTSGPSPQVPPAVPPLDTALTQQQTVSHSMCESNSTPTAQHPSTTLDLTKDEQLQRALELVAHRIGIASEELERLKKDLHLIARAKGGKDGDEGAAVNGAKGAVAIEA